MQKMKSMLSAVSVGLINYTTSRTIATNTVTLYKKCQPTVFNRGIVKTYSSIFWPAQEHMLDPVFERKHFTYAPFKEHPLSCSFSYYRI